MFTNIALVGDGFLNTVPVIIITCLAIWLKNTNYFRNNKIQTYQSLKSNKENPPFFSSVRNYPALFLRKSRFLCTFAA